MISVFCLGHWLYDWILHNVNEQDEKSSSEDE